MFCLVVLIHILLLCACIPKIRHGIYPMSSFQERKILYSFGVRSLFLLKNTPLANAKLVLNILNFFIIIFTVCMCLYVGTFQMS